MQVVSWLTLHMASSQLTYKFLAKVEFTYFLQMHSRIGTLVINRNHLITSTHTIKRVLCSELSESTTRKKTWRNDSLPSRPLNFVHLSRTGIFPFKRHRKRASSLENGKFRWRGRYDHACRRSGRRMDDWRWRWQARWVGSSGRWRSR